MWYVDRDKTDGSGDVPLISRASGLRFTDSGEVFIYYDSHTQPANNDNIMVGTYQTDESNGLIEITGNTFGSFVFRVRQLSQREIVFIHTGQNVRYYLKANGSGT